MGQVKPSKKQIAAAIGVSQPMVSKYVRAGMPVYSVEAAIRWRDQHIDPLRRKEWLAAIHGHGPAPAPAPVPAADVDRVAALFRAAAVDFDRWQGELRAALRAVPHVDRHRVLLDAEVAHRLIAPALAAVADVLQPPGATQDDDEGELAGGIVYALAAGEIVADGNRWLYDPSVAHLFADD